MPASGGWIIQGTGQQARIGNDQLIHRLVVTSVTVSFLDRQLGWFRFPRFLRVDIRSQGMVYDREKLLASARLLAHLRCLDLLCFDLGRFDLADATVSARAGCRCGSFP